MIDDLKLFIISKNLFLIVGGIVVLDFVDFFVEMGIDCVVDSVYLVVKIVDSFNILEKMKLIVFVVEIIVDDWIIRIVW